MIFLRHYKKYIATYYKHTNENDFDNKQLHLHDHLLGFHVKLLSDSCDNISVDFIYYRITIELTYFVHLVDDLCELLDYFEIDFSSGHKKTFHGFNFCDCLKNEDSRCYFHNRALNEQYNKEHKYYQIPFAELPKISHISE